MPEFEYKAVSKDEYIDGKISASTEAEAETALVEQGLSVISIRVRRPMEIGVFSDFVTKFETEMAEKMTTQDKILFTGQLSSMIKAGLPMIEALSTFSDTKTKKGTSRIVGKIILEVQSGVKLSDALAAFPKVFSPAYLAIVQSGENSGTLAESLSYLAVELKRESDLINKVRSALIYPVVVLVAMVSVMVFISISVVPKIIQFAESSGQQLPGYTLVLVSVVTFISNYWYLVIGLIIMLIISVMIFAQSEYGSRWLGMVSLRIPVIGVLVARYNQARFASVLGGFYSYGINVITSFDILAESLTNPIYKDACYRIKDRLSYGQSLADAMADEGDLFPSIMIRLIKGAEKTGDLGNTLDRSARYYEEELEVALRNVLSLIEPALVFALGFGVLGLALAVVVPIYKITSTLK
ncbi:MAG: Tfp pilus biogenesis protein PilC, type IV pilus assembly protein PilC [Candidatus Collierbacteria bacterium GW2011_GWC1_45_47]|uniref:Tfp pilus biogenesis protein PilC n=6 Tax=Candidatus Collieribacteriota TaxID=1752725 RepID=A0A0G1HHC4_9BACT|nr:MAG: Tfp pilus biogenesis protein PilC [Candidatus Collierbacteria bacterium GW2011_GWA1_44_12]KKT39228.1 MAG: Tfp pilus biogenesis protein PilC [Candidatus Collierbacteria bacterium GW2011_GWF1_44_12]KKT46661.1 MAG: Tfp pilus biogenesis protein PilC [Candidatus Collierbacteria bacterium GW2011_GWF2_44_15]KKT67952.1 MAG: Tfp pilus biogenesis protein PilC [Candidatus Collierbacteria bacterium GW2011_GWB1_44_35]KKU00317.1 MAG: Tfp pilus biogenesis protein PilC [Candidatus Collierbacteria bacte